MYKLRNKAKRDQTATPSKYPQGHFKPKACRKCTNRFEPKAPSELYCSDSCKDFGVISAYLMRNYGIDCDRYNEMLKEQNHLCCICNTEGWVMAPHHNLKLVVDHDHRTGSVRGLLCHNCNRGLGLFQDSTNNLKAALAYLERCNDYPARE